MNFVFTVTSTEEVGHSHVLDASISCDSIGYNTKLALMGFEGVC